MISAWFSNLGLKIWGYITFLGGLLLLLAYIISNARQRGKDEVIQEIQKEELKDVQKAQKVEQEVAGSKPSDVYSELQKYERD